MRNTKGITLVVLVVTIVVLLILVGITINAFLGSNLINKSEFAKEKSEYTSAKEILNIEIMGIISNQKNLEYSIEDLYKGMQDSEVITIITYYTSNSARVKDGIETDVSKIINLEQIVVQVNEYPNYYFLIGKDSKIKGVMKNNNSSTIEKDKFLTVKEFEKSNFGEEIDKNENELVDVSILEDSEKFKSEIEDTKKLEYIIDKSDIFMDKILENEELRNILLENKNSIDLIIENGTWRNKILENNGDKTGESGELIKSLDKTNCINLPTSNLTLYNSSTGNGNVLYSAYLRNSSIHSPINAFVGGVPGSSDWETPSDGLPGYIGFDFGENTPVWVYKVYIKGGNNSSPTKAFLQASDDNKTWNNIYEFTRYTKPTTNTKENYYITEVINSPTNNSRHRYWRLYITASTGGDYVDLLKWNVYAK